LIGQFSGRFERLGAGGFVDEFEACSIGLNASLDFGWVGSVDGC
jgi:hypothetical protein